MERYCRNCGTKLPEEARFCPSCGTVTEQGYSGQHFSSIPQYQAPEINVLAIVGFILALVSLIFNFFGAVGIVGIVLSAIALSQSPEGDRNRGMAVAGVIIGGISALWGVLSIFRFF